MFYIFQAYVWFFNDILLKLSTHVNTVFFKKKKILKSRHNITAKAVRDDFKDYFMNEGAVDWQWKCC